MLCKLQKLTLREIRIWYMSKHREGLWDLRVCSSCTGWEGGA